MLLTGEMLMMLIMLNPFPDFPKSPKHELTLLTFPLPQVLFEDMDLTLLTLLTFPLWRAKNASGRGNDNNVNIVKSISGFSQESQI